MRIKSIKVVGFLLVLAFTSGLFAQDNASLKAKVAALYDKTNQYCAAKDIEGFMSLMTDDFQLIMAGSGRETVRIAFTEFFKKYGQLRADYEFLAVVPSGNMIKVVYNFKIEGKNGDEDWKAIFQGSAIDFLRDENGVLRMARSAEVDKYRLPNVIGQSYIDEQIGFSFKVPANWEIIPSAHPTMQGVIYVIAPDKSSLALFGFVKAPGANAQQAAEGDEALGKQMSDPNTYQLYKSGPISVNGHAGYEMESRFHCRRSPLRPLFRRYS
jgi:ketosteroid isomerase-like protein